MLLSLSAVPSTIAPECTPSLPPADPGDERRPAEPDNPADALAGHLAAPHRLVELVATDAQERRGLGDVEHLLGLLLSGPCLVGLAGGGCHLAHGGGASFTPALRT